jgi:hypothetical protein
MTQALYAHMNNKRKMKKKKKKGCKHVFTPAEETHEHTVAISGFSLHPDAVVPAPHLGSVQVKGSQPVNWLKGWGDGLG